jgi:hypothetical protein
MGTGRVGRGGIWPHFARQLLELTFLLTGVIGGCFFIGAPIKWVISIGAPIKYPVKNTQFLRKPCTVTEKAAWKAIKAETGIGTGTIAMNRVAHSPITSKPSSPNPRHTDETALYFASRPTPAPTPSKRHATLQPPLRVSSPSPTPQWISCSRAGPGAWR